MAIVVTKPEIASSAIRAEVNELLYSLKIDSKRNEQLERLLIERDIEIKEAYRFSYGVVVLDREDNCVSSDTFYHACEIIALKERYAKRIRRCKIRRQRFEDLLNELPQKDAETLATAFCTSIVIDEREVKKIMRKHIKTIRKYYPKD